MKNLVKFILCCFLLVIVGCILFWFVGDNTFFHITNISPKSLVEISVSPTKRENNHQIVVVMDSIRPRQTTNDELIKEIRLERGLDYEVEIKINGKEFSTSRCTLVAYSVVYVTIVNTDSLNVIVNCRTYQYPWDIGFIVD
ncbi:MAG: hypothetical protein JNM78_13425 [Cyclobacteriaceae bacterium]|nr:hypothetical protein [Cyclobacteriaceae bacterium]